LAAAQQLVQQLLTAKQSGTPPSAAGAATAAARVEFVLGPVMPPFPVLVHYVKTVVDVLQGLLLKPTQGSSAAGDSRQTRLQ
jgi:hypothetical protein